MISFFKIIFIAISLKIINDKIYKINVIIKYNNF